MCERALTAILLNRDYILPIDTSYVCPKSSFSVMVPSSNVDNKGLCGEMEAGTSRDPLWSLSDWAFNIAARWRGNVNSLAWNSDFLSPAKEFQEFQSSRKVMFSVVTVHQSVRLSMRKSHVTITYDGLYLTVQVQWSPTDTRHHRTSHQCWHLVVIEAYVVGESGWYTSYWNVFSCFLSLISKASDK